MVWAIPKIIKFTQPVAEYKEVVWPEGPSDPELPLKERKPNIILILADDLGFNDVSLYNGGAGDGTLMTPNIDRIGKEGVRFNNGYAASASCSPSRASLMTGRYATRFGYEFTPFYSIGRTIFKWIDQIENPLIRTQFAEISEENKTTTDGTTRFTSTPPWRHEASAVRRLSRSLIRSSAARSRSSSPLQRSCRTCSPPRYWPSSTSGQP